MHKRRHLLLVCGLLGGAVLIGAEPEIKSEPVPAAPAAHVSADARTEALEKENELLRKENQALRRQVVALRSRLGGAEAEKAADDARRGGAELDKAAEKVEPGKENDERWLSGSGRRHNSSCRYFKTGNGRLCTEKEGTPCKVCGG